MTRETFLKELAYLLQDIPDEERQDALQYYGDYFDEAGPEREQEILRELGSPERIAAMVRSNLNGTLEENGEFTESGYQDSRYRDPNCQLAPRKDLPEERAENGKRDDGSRGAWNGAEGGSRSDASGAWNSSAGGSRSDASGAWNNSAGGSRHDASGAWNSSGNDAGNGGRSGARPHDSLVNRLFKVALILILICVAVPFALGLGGGLMGIFWGILGILVFLFFFLGLGTAAALIFGVVFLFSGIGSLFVSPLSGALVLGIGLMGLGGGLLLLALSLLFYGRLLPAMIRLVIDGLNRLVHKRDSRRRSSS